MKIPGTRRSRFNLRIIFKPLGVKFFLLGTNFGHIGVNFRPYGVGLGSEVQFFSCGSPTLGVDFWSLGVDFSP